MDTGTLFRLDGRVALVTGGSRGIGRMIAAGFVAQGAKVYVSSRKAEACEETAAELGPNCIPLPADIARSTVAVTSPRHWRRGRNGSTSSSTMPVRPGAYRSTIFRRRAGTR